MERNKKKWIVVTLLMGWLVSISGVFGNSGVIQAYNLSQVRRDMSLRIKALENEKQRLRSTYLALEHDSFIQEQAIRETLGFVRENEIVFEFK